MLTLVLLFLVALLASAIAVWMYRRLPEVQGFISELLSQSDSPTKSNGGLQHFMSSVLTPNSNARNFKGGKARNMKLRGPKGNIKAPWGW